MKNLNEIVYNWSYALLDLAKEENKLHDITSQVVEIEKVIKANKEYLRYLNTYSVAFETKSKLIDEAFSKFNKYVVNFIKLAIQANVAKYLLIIFKKYIEMANKELNIKHGTIYTTTKLTAAEIAKFEKKLSNRLKTEVHLVNQIDENLIAGIKIKVEDYIFENSIEAYLDNFRKQSSN